MNGQWKATASTWRERYVFYLGGESELSYGVRLLRMSKTEQWRVRWKISPGGFHEEFLPAHMPLEQAKAMAIAVWRMS